MEKIIGVLENECLMRNLKRVCRKSGYFWETKSIEQICMEGIKEEIVIIDDKMNLFDLKCICSSFFQSNNKKILMIITEKNIDMVRMAKIVKLGISDYVIYPFNQEEIIMRLNIMNLNCEKEELKVGNVVLDKRKLIVNIKGEEIPLSKKEYSIVYCLLKDIGKIISKESLYDNVIGYDSEAEFRIIAEYIYVLRKKLKKAGFNCIETVYGVGYKWSMV